MAMASSAIRAPTCICPSSTTISRPTIFNVLSPSLNLHSKTSRLNLCALLLPPKGLGGHFSPWSGLKHLGLSVSWRSSKFERKRCRDRVAYASLFGVGAPEALVIGVVALLVFGPKGLAEVARSLGKTLRAFQPTIRELQEVSREFKSTLEKEIGLDDISSSTPTAQSFNRTTATQTSSPVSVKQETKIAADPNGTSSSEGALTSEELLKVTEEQLEASASKSQQEQTSFQSETSLEAQANIQDGASLSKGAYTSEELLKVTEEQLKASASQQQETSLQSETPLEAQEAKLQDKSSEGSSTAAEIPLSDPREDDASSSAKASASASTTS